MDNPYRHHGPITQPEVFYGRKGLMTRVYSRIGVDRPQSMSIVGEPKIGKSSLLRMLSHEQTKQRSLDDPHNYLYVFIPLKEERLDRPEAFFRVIFDKVHAQEPRLAEAITEPSYDGIGRLAETLKGQYAKMILFLDDFHVITQDERFPLEFFSFLRSVANNYNVAYITTSHEELQKLCVLQAVGESPFFNIFTNVTLKPFTPEELAQFLTASAAQSGVSLLPYQDVIVDLAGYFPYLDQIVCESLFTVKPSGGRLEPSVLDDLRAQFLVQVRPFYQSIWESFDRQEREICRAVFSKESLSPQVEFVAKNLQRRSYLVNENGAYRFFCSSFRLFVAEQCGLEASWEESGKGMIEWFKSMWRG